MLLVTEEGSDVENPDEAQMRAALNGLGKESGTFAILTRREEPSEYLQTSGEKNAFIVEYREGDRHFRAADTALPLDKTTALFLAYCRGSDAWRKMTEWQEVTEEVKGGRWLARIIIAIVILLIVLAIAVKLLK